MPIAKAPGDEVLGGTLNQHGTSLSYPTTHPTTPFSSTTAQALIQSSCLLFMHNLIHPPTHPPTLGAFLMRATSVGRDTALSQILALVQEAQLSKPPIQRYADRLASLFTPCVMLFASLVFMGYVLPPIHPPPHL